MFLSFEQRYWSIDFTPWLRQDVLDVRRGVVAKNGLTSYQLRLARPDFSPTPHILLDQSLELLEARDHMDTFTSV